MTDQERKEQFRQRLRKKVLQQSRPAYQVAKLAGISADRLYQLINQNKLIEPRLCEIARLCEALHLSPVRMLGLEEEEERQ